MENYTPVEMYISSKGEEKKISEMETSYLLNAIVKLAFKMGCDGINELAKIKEIPQSDPENQMLYAMKLEVVNRINANAEKSA